MAEWLKGWVMLKHVTTLKQRKSGTCVIDNPSQCIWPVAATVTHLLKSNALKLGMALTCNHLFNHIIKYVIGYIFVDKVLMSLLRHLLRIL